MPDQKKYLPKFEDVKHLLDKKTLEKLIARSPEEREILAEIMADKKPLVKSETPRMIEAGSTGMIGTGTGSTY
jgi:hypothetical protein